MTESGPGFGGAKIQKSVTELTAAGELIRGVVYKFGIGDLLYAFWHDDS